jgi:hypothetical protein
MNPDSSAPGEIAAEHIKSLSRPVASHRILFAITGQTGAYYGNFILDFS